LVALILVSSLALRTTARASLPITAPRAAAKSAGRVAALKRVLTSPTAKKIGRGVLRVGAFGGGMALALTPQTVPLGDPRIGNMLVAAGWNLMVSSFKGDITQAPATNLGLIAASTVGGYLLGSGPDTTSGVAGLLTVFFSGIANAGLTIYSLATAEAGLRRPATSGAH
jgi:hypothetical protein